MSEPHHLTQALTKQAFETVGHMAVQWGMMEFALDALIAVLFHDFDGKSIAKELPRRFVDKTRFVTSMLAVPDGAVKLHSRELDSIVGKLGNMSQFRHDVIHGFLSRYEPHKALYVFVTMDRTNDKLHHLARERRMTGAELMEIGWDAQSVSERITRIVVELLKAKYRQDEIADLLSHFEGK
jgi:hypothetical protein